MVRDVSVDLETFTLSSSLDKSFVLAVRTSILLSLPDDHSGAPTASELRDQVKTGSLWITRAGSCTFALSIHFEDPLTDNVREDLEHTIVGAFEAFPAWSALGLDIRREYNGFHDQPGSDTPYPYSIHHVRTNSSLVSPDRVPCAFLTTVSCNLSFEAKKTPAQEIQLRAGPKTNKTRIVTLKLPPRKLRRFAKRKPRDDERNHLPKIRPMKSRLTTLKVLPHELRRTAVENPGFYGLATGLQQERLQNLTHTALKSLLGLGKRFLGFRFLHRPECPTLLEIAPAVWNARYFQDIVSRAHLAPFISSALGSLVSAESPSLQQKLQSWPFGQVQELHKQTLLLMLRSSHVPKANSRGSQTSTHLQQPSEEATEMSRRHDHDEPSKPNSAYATEDPLALDSVSSCTDIEEAAISMSGTIQGDGLLHETETETLEDCFSGHSSQPIRQEFLLSSGLYRYSGRPKSQEFHHLGRLDADVPLDDRSIEATVPCHMEHYDRMVQQHDNPFASGMSEDSPEFVQETGECEHRDDVYLEAELALSKALAYDDPYSGSFESESSINDRSDDIYSTAQQELVEALACKYKFNDDEQVQDGGNASLMNITQSGDGLVGEGIADGDEYPHADSMSICSSFIPIDSPFCSMNLKYTGIYEAASVTEAFDQNTEDYAYNSEESEDWDDFGDGRLHCTDGELEISEPSYHLHSEREVGQNVMSVHDVASLHGWHQMPRHQARGRPV